MEQKYCDELARLRLERAIELLDITRLSLQLSKSAIFLIMMISTLLVRKVR